MRFIYLILILLLTSCGIQWQYTTLNHVGYVDGIYRSSDYKVDTISSVSDLEWKLRTDFNFRYDFAQYALSQPRSFDWNNRILGNRYNNYNPYWGQSYYWNRDQMWNDWVWGYSYPNFGWNSWYNRNRPYYYSWYGYNSWYNGPWNNLGYNVIWNSSRRNNVTYINGYRTSNRTSTRTVVSNTNRRTSPTTNNRTIIVKKPRVNYNNKPRINTPKIRVNTPPRTTPTIRTTPSRSTRSSNNNTVRINSRRKN